MSIIMENIGFQYKKGVEILSGFSIEVNKGEIVALLGESGSGKSTILRLLAGLEMPSSGWIAIDGKKVVDDNTFIQPEKRGVGIVFQDYALFPNMTVTKNIEFAMRKIKTNEKRKKVDEILKMVRLEQFSKNYPHELSGGQQQRVALARAIAAQSKIILMDEPFSNLDTHLKGEIRKEIRELIKRLGITMIFVTHDKEDSKVLADRAVLIRNGKKESEGNPENIYEI